MQGFFLQSRLPVIFRVFIDIQTFRHSATRRKAHLSNLTRVSAVCLSVAAHYVLCVPSSGPLFPVVRLRSAAHMLLRAAHLSTPLRASCLRLLTSVHSELRAPTSVQGDQTPVQNVGKRDQGGRTHRGSPQRQ